MTTTQSMSTSNAALGHPGTAAAFRKIKLLAGCYLGISALAVVAIALMRHHPAEVSSAVWTHGIVVTASAVMVFGLAVRAARGSRGACRRLRISSAVIVVVIAVIIALPGSFPLWMKAEQGLAGLFMIGVAVLVNAATCGRCSPPSERRMRRQPHALAAQTHGETPMAVFGTGR